MYHERPHTVREACLLSSLIYEDEEFSWMRDLIGRLEASGRLVEIEREVSSKYEAAAICAEIERRERKAVLFHAVDGAHCVLMNAVCGRDVLADILRVRKDELTSHLAGVLRRVSSYSDAVRIVEESPTKEVVERDLSGIPILTYFREDGGPYISSGVVVACHEGVVNASFHRMMLIDSSKLAVRLVPSRHLFRMHRDAVEHGCELSVGVVIGASPLFMLASATRVQAGAEFAYAAALHGAPVEVFRLKNGVVVPHGEYVIEGRLTAERSKEGPFLDITGTYDRVREEPVLAVDRVYHRKEPIYHAIMPASTEHKTLMGVPYEPLIFNAVENAASVRDVVLTEGGCCYLHAVVQIDKTAEGEAKNAILAAFAAHPSLKCVIVVDKDINPHDISSVEYAIATRVRWSEDVVFVPRAKGSSLDPSSDDGIMTKIGIDATSPAPPQNLQKFPK